MGASSLFYTILKNPSVMIVLKLKGLGMNRSDLERVILAIRGEEELEGDLDPGLEEEIFRVGIHRSMQVLVKLTKDSIEDRVLECFQDEIED